MIMKCFVPLIPQQLANDNLIIKKKKIKHFIDLQFLVERLQNKCIPAVTPVIKVTK